MINPHDKPEQGPALPELYDVRDWPLLLAVRFDPDGTPVASFVIAEKFRSQEGTAFVTELLTSILAQWIKGEYTRTSDIDPKPVERGPWEDPEVGQS
jgi:hypothetical protein